MNRLSKFSGNYIPIQNKNGLFDAVGGIISSMFGFGSNIATNQANTQIAKDNIAYQEAVNKQEQANYLDETEYNRALQQKIFDREDTAIERQAQSLSNLGINPLSQNMQGLNAGNVVQNANKPNLTAPHNDFKMRSLMEDVAPAMTLANGIANLHSEGLQRDKLREENDYQRLMNQEKAMENLIKANQNGIKFDENGNPNMAESFVSNQKKTQADYDKARADANRSQREDTFQENFGGHDLQSAVNAIATDTAHQAMRAQQGLIDAADEAKKKAVDPSIQAIESLSTAAKEKLNEVKEETKNRFKDGFKKAGNKIKSGANWLLDKINNYGNKYMDSYR